MISHSQIINWQGWQDTICFECIDVIVIICFIINIYSKYRVIKRGILTVFVQSGYEEHCNKMMKKN